MNNIKEKWYNFYKLSQHYLDKRCYWVTPSQEYYGGLSHTLVLYNNSDDLQLEEKYDISNEDILNRGKQAEVYEELRNANFIRIHIFNNGAYIDLENISANIHRLEDVLYKLDPKEVKYIQINNLPTFNLKDFIYGGVSLSDYLGLYKVAFSMEDIINQLPSDWERQKKKDDFIAGIRDVADQFEIEQREAFLKGKIGVLGYNHFVPRPGKTEVSINSDITPDKIIQENIDKFGDFPILLKWEGGEKAGREVVPASQFVRDRRMGKYSPSYFTPQENAIIDEWLELRTMYRGEEMPIEVQQKLKKLDEKIQNLPPASSYVRHAEVASDWNPPFELHQYVDRRELEAQEAIRQERMKG